MRSPVCFSHGSGRAVGMACANELDFRRVSKSENESRAWLHIPAARSRSPRLTRRHCKKERSWSCMEFQPNHTVLQHLSS
jgi:hypothetical protein